MDKEPSISKILWRCRRGTRELDVILTGFVNSSYATLDETEKAEFVRLLDTEDPVLTGWLCHQLVPEDQGLVKIVRRILSAP